MSRRDRRDSAGSRALANQYENIVGAPGIADNPFEIILAKYGVVRDDIRRSALRRDELEHSVRTREDSQSRMSSARDNQLRDFIKDHPNLMSAEMSPQGGLRFSNHPKQRVPGQASQPKGSSKTSPAENTPPAGAPPAGGTPKENVVRPPHEVHADISSLAQDHKAGKISTEEYKEKRRVLMGEWKNSQDWLNQQNTTSNDNQSVNTAGFTGTTDSKEATSGTFKPGTEVRDPSSNEGGLSSSGMTDEQRKQHFENMKNPKKDRDETPSNNGDDYSPSDLSGQGSGNDRDPANAGAGNTGDNKK